MWGSHSFADGGEGGGRALTATLGNPGRGSLQCEQPAEALGKHTSESNCFPASQWIDHLPCPWSIQLNALMSNFYAEPVLCLKDEHRSPPCRVAAEASSAALPSCQLLQLLPAAWKPAGISGCGRAGPASGAPLLCPAQGTTARRPHLQWELLLQHSRLLQQLFGSDGFKFLWSIALHFIGQCSTVYLPT